mgnify:FL=1
MAIVPTKHESSMDALNELSVKLDFLRRMNTSRLLQGSGIKLSWRTSSAGMLLSTTLPTCAGTEIITQSAGRWLSFSRLFSCSVSGLPSQDRLQDVNLLPR